MRTLLSAALLFGSLANAADYKGPRPPKPDVPYLLQADRLIPTEEGTAQEDKKKDSSTYGISGVTSSARTPVAEPIFIIDAKNISPERLGLYRMETKNGRREIVINTKKRGNGPRQIRLNVTKLSGTLYRVEAAELLENGQYCLSPEGANQVFCFEEY